MRRHYRRLARGEDPSPGNERRSAGRRSSSCVVAGAAGRSWSGKAGEGRLRPASPPPWQGPGWPLALEEVRDVQVLLLGVEHHGLRSRLEHLLLLLLQERGGRL